ncbi:hypothetical protein DB30_00576 [Enhygromyxa salina]|uniref:Uncharacterized protein n=1 Tax=Enhygromyxa salina TaxID=215803 RepID=A0A0C2CPI4_9BACT|nr:hypothetical protein [Enhygromyxa salina]KIG13111.1 hypothetical protein DB30_00576 [Enhygromyxa salina]
MDHACRACGSPSGGTYVCHYCGAATQLMSDPAQERMALDELHGRLASGGESEKILQNAFVPTSTEVLIEAGLRLLPVLEKGVAEDGAAGRMRAIIIKLELTGHDKSATMAAAQLKQALEDYRRSDRVTGYWVMALFFATLAAIGYWIWGD